MVDASRSTLLETLGDKEDQLPLTGVRVLDLTRVWAGPLAARQLADLGAEVIRLEHRDSRGPAVIPPDSGLRLGIFPQGQSAPDPWNRQGAINKLNRNKLSLCLDVQKPQGMEILRSLIAMSDVLIENFSSRVMRNWGLGWETLREINPGLVYVALPGFGGTGPYSNFVANGAIIEPHSGLAALMAYDESQPYRTQATFSDPLVGVAAAWAAIAGLLHREQTGEGTVVDLAHTETTTRVIGPEIMAFQGGMWTPAFANRDPDYVPQGVYPCAGDDEWLAVSVTADDKWMALCQLLEIPGMSGLDIEARAARHDEIDASIAAWTSPRDKITAMDALQAAGIAAGAVLKNSDMVDSGVLAEDFFVRIRENWGVTMSYPGFPVSMGESSRMAWHRSPCLGEHNRLILSTLVGLSDEEIDALYAAGTLAESPSG